VKLADVSKGIIDVTWDYVDCGISTPLQIHMKEGVSAFWFSAQAVNANKVCQSSGLSRSVVDLLDSVSKISKSARMEAVRGRVASPAWNTTSFNSRLALA
jgi:hypothetical protein